MASTYPSLHFHIVFGTKNRVPWIQAEHHRVKTFREELIEMLERAGVEYDERFLD
ncbi:MAG: hypothetical protein NT069_31580 [Planctomycetota bacterium]|nr:hypothetical protein [Planctomycetota bacterium]